MEYLITGIVKLPDHATPEDVARFEAQLVERIKLDTRDAIYEGKGRDPLVYWSFHPLNCPFPLDWRENDPD